MMDFFEKAGCPLKTERGERVFPVSDHSSDVIAALLRELKKAKVEIRYNTEVRELCQEEGKIKGVLLKDGNKIPAGRVIVATGGMSYESTGSTGDGYAFAGQVGHTVTRLVPALVPFHIREEWCRDLMGLSLKNVAVRLADEKREYYSGFGEMLFTHFGVSGPLILSASSFYAKYIYGKTAALTIDLKPALSTEQLDRRLVRDFEANKNKQFSNALGGLFPNRLIPIMVRLSGIPPEKKVHDVSRKEREKL